jgi:DNA-binding response OmpR family regulator
LATDVATVLLPQLNGNGADPLQAEGFKVLVVEDDNFLRDLLARKLGQENCQFTAAIDGENALKLMSENKPSIVLLDLILPGIDGFEVLSQIKQNESIKDVPVVILSNLGQESDIKRARELGADDFLVKANFSIDEVIAKIKELIASGSMSAPSRPGSDAPETSTQAQ